MLNIRVARYASSMYRPRKWSSAFDGPGGLAHDHGLKPVRVISSSPQRYTEPSPGYLGLTGHPPLRDDADVNALWRAIADKTVDFVGSDHAGWTLAQKAAGEQDVARLPAGMIGLETQSRAIYTAGVATGRISTHRFVELTSTGPAIANGLYPNKGEIAVGSDADMVLWDPRRRGTIRYTDMHSGVDYEPCDGMNCVGWPVRTIARGESIVVDGQFTGRPARGRMLRRFDFAPQS